MKKKIIIGSIIAFVILIGLSFTSVIGYRNIRPVTIEQSPLFEVRTKRAIGEISEDFIFNCIFKGNTLPFPKKDDRIILIQNIIEIIGSMDDETFEKFFISVNNHINNDKRYNSLDSKRLSKEILLVKNSDLSIFEADILKIKSDYDFKGDIIWTLSEPFCLMKFVIITILSVFIQFIIWCSNSPPTMVITGCCGATIDCPKTIRRLLP